MQSDHALISKGGIPLAHFRLIGIEIVFNHPEDRRGRVWIPFSGTNHLIYGRNGVGKSTIIDCIRAALTGESPRTPNIRVDLYVELAEEEPLSKTEISLMARWYLRGEDDSVLDDLTDELQEFDEATSTDSETEHETGIPDRRFFSSFTSSLARSLVHDVFDDYAAFTDTIEHLFGPEYVWSDLAFLYPDSRRQLPTRLLRAGVLAALYNRDCSDAFRNVTELDLDLIAQTYREVNQQRFYCLHPRGHGTWDIEMAAQLSEETPALITVVSLCEDYKEITRIAYPPESHTDPDTLEYLDDTTALNYGFPLLALVDWELAVNQLIGPDPEHSFVRLSSWDSASEFKRLDALSNDFPVVLDLDTNFDFSTWCKSVMHDMFETVGRWAPTGADWEVSFSQIVAGYQPDDLSASSGQVSEQRVLSSRLEKYTSLLEAVSDSLRTLDIGLGAAKLSISLNVRDWINGESARVIAQDQSSLEWVTIDRLSDAQRKILGTLIQLHSAEMEGRLIIGLADEPEQNLHPSAVKQLFKLIDAKFPVSYVSTHSPIALSIRGPKRMHAFRNGDGHLRVNVWTPSRNMQDDAQTLGIEKALLLSTVGIVIAVEGEHDRVAIEAILEPNKENDALQILVIPMRGHTGITTIADSFVWLEMTDAYIMSVVDNATTEKLKDLRNKILAELQAGSKYAMVEKKLHIADLQKDSTPEERSQIDLMVRAAKNGIIARVHPFGLSKLDVIEYAPPQAFALSETWDTLRKEYVESKNRKNFKDWLITTKGAQISVRTIKAAFEDLDVLHSDLVHLIQTVKTLA